MTRTEIQVTVFLLVALLLGALVRQWRIWHPPAQVPAIEDSRKWPRPPYVFKGQKELDERARSAGED
jgi:hypothetical protein